MQTFQVKSTKATYKGRECCRCNDSGSCVKCKCVKTGTSCVSCLPLKRGRCRNARTDLAQAVPQNSSNTPVPSSNSSPPVPATTSSYPSPSSSNIVSQSSLSHPLSSLAPSSDHVDGCHFPPPEPVADANFVWGVLDAHSFCKVISEAYSEVVHWRKDYFRVPNGSSGKDFVSELARLFKAYAVQSSLESIALKAISVACVLLLQRPHPNAKASGSSSCLSRRLKLWQECHVNDLVSEGRSIQQRLYSKAHRTSKTTLARRFTSLMFLGKTKDAIRLLSTSDCGGPLDLNEIFDGKSVLEILESKHPPPRPTSPEALFHPDVEPPTVHPVVFEAIDARCIRSTALHTFGAAGPSGTDAACWRRLCTAYKKASNDLCHAISLVSRRLCSSYVDPSCISPLLACRLIPLNKNPGVRPIGVCETVRRIIAKAVLSISRLDVLEACGSLQLCAGHCAGVEAAIHAVRTTFNEESVDGVLLVDASNAFNSLNRRVALLNVQHLCPILAPFAINCYRESTDLFVGGKIIKSQEGTTQGDPLAMPLYGISTIHLIKSLSSSSQVQQVWYADDSAAVGTLPTLHKWWQSLRNLGPSFGYYVNASKSWLLVKEGMESRAREMFEGSDIQITTAGRPYLGAPIGSTTYITECVEAKVNSWLSILTTLTEVAASSPHAAYAALTHGISSLWVFLCRSTPNISNLLQPLEDLIRTKLIPTLTGSTPPNDCERRLFALPVRLGGLNIISPVALNREHGFSVSLTYPLVSLFLDQSGQFSMDTLARQQSVKYSIRADKRKISEAESHSLLPLLSGDLRYAVSLAQEKGASAWLSARPLSEHKFSLHKGAFRDALALRYGWTPKGFPCECVCGASFSVEHALSCNRGGFPTLRHNEVRDLTATLLTEVCTNVEVEPPLQELSGEVLTRSANSESGARSDIAVDGFWEPGRVRTFCDIRVFNPFAPTNRKPSLSSTYKAQEKEKKRQYNQRITEIEHGSFSPLVFSTSGGLGKEATVFYKRLASRLSDHWDQHYSVTLGWLRSTLSFSLLRSSIQCIRGARSSRGRPSFHPLPVDVVRAEAHFVI